MKLRKGQILYINNQKYTVVNMIAFTQDAWNWQEYGIRNEAKVTKWLSIEENEYWLYETYGGEVNTNEQHCYRNSQIYELYEHGRAVVNDYFGNADVEKYESCEYFDYISPDKKTIISVEKWDGEIEHTIGTYIESSQVQITEEMGGVSQSFGNGQPPKRKGIMGTIIALLVAIPVLCSMLLGGFGGKSIEKYLSKAKTKYTYVTSITNNSNRKKAKVYQSKFSTIDATVKDIIDGVPKAITDVIDTVANSQEDGIGIRTKKEYAYVYEENNKIYVQVSSKEYVNRSGTMYHSHHYYHYYGGYTSNRRSTDYTNYAYSARQNSVNSRSFVGGGTSSGK